MKRRVLYFFESVFYNCILRFFFWRRPKYKKKYRISICGIFKNEGPFLQEWIEYHLMIGVDHLYMYNNNSDDEYLRILQPYIANGSVTLIDWTKNHAQMEAYKDCFDRFRNETQWLSFIDLDEFIVPRKEKDINEWIKGYERYPSILLYWKMFGTGGKMKHDYNQLVIEQYYVCQNGFGLHIGKCIFNTDYEIAYYHEITHHYTCVYYKLLGIKIRVVPINVFKRFVIKGFYYTCLDRYNQASIQLNHYWSKAWSLYEEKRRRSDVYWDVNPKLNLNYFYKDELLNCSSDYTVFRFVMMLKHRILNIK